MIWRSKLMAPIFNTRRGYPRMHVWCKFWRFQLKPVMSYRAGKVTFTDGQTDWRMDGRTDRRKATTIPLWPERSRGKISTSDPYIHTRLSWQYTPGITNSVKWIPTVQTPPSPPPHESSKLILPRHLCTYTRIRPPLMFDQLIIYRFILLRYMEQYK